MSLVKNNDLVYIKVQGRNLYLADQLSRSYCAVAGPWDERTPFYVTFGQFQNKPFIRLKYAKHHGYLGSNKYLYAATTGSTKYDVQRPNTKQMWVLNNKYDVNLKYDEPVQLMDLYVFSYMAVQINSDASGKKNG